jgi:hypothetical protein
MSRIKAFLESVSVSLGQGGEINEKVLEVAKARMSAALLLDEQYENEIKEIEIYIKNKGK